MRLAVVVPPYDLNNRGGLCRVKAKIEFSGSKGGRRSALTHSVNHRWGRCERDRFNSCESRQDEACTSKSHSVLVERPQSGRVMSGER